MNTLLVSPPSQTTLTRKPTLPPPPRNESPLDRAIRLAGITPISKEEVARHKRRVLINEKMQEGIPLWWSGEVHAGIEKALVYAFLLSSVCLLWGLMAGAIAASKLGTLEALVPYILLPICVWSVIVFIGMYLANISWSAPYWVTTSFERYRATHDSWSIPSTVWELIDEIKPRLLKVRFEVTCLAHSTDPILKVIHRGPWSITRDERYLMIWE